MNRNKKAKSDRKLEIKFSSEKFNLLFYYTLDQEDKAFKF